MKLISGKASISYSKEEEKISEKFDLTIHGDVAPKDKIPENVKEVKEFMT